MQKLIFLILSVVLLITNSLTLNLLTINSMMHVTEMMSVKEIFNEQIDDLTEELRHRDQSASTHLSAFRNLQEHHRIEINKLNDSLNGLNDVIKGNYQVINNLTIERNVMEEFLKRNCVGSD